MSNSSQNCVIPRFIRYKKKKEITNRWIRDITIYIFARLIKRKRLSLAPLRPFHQRSNRVRALIWGGAISATDVTPFPGQSSFQRRGCVSYVIPEERRGHWTAPGVETLLTLLRQNAPSPPRIKWHELPSSACFSFPSLLFFPYFSPLSFCLFSYTNNSVRVPFSASSLRFFFPFPLNLQMYPPLSILSVSLFLRFVYYYPRHRDPHHEEFFILYISPSLPLFFSPRTMRFHLPPLPPCEGLFPYVRIPFVQYRVYNRADRGVCLSRIWYARRDVGDCLRPIFFPFLFFFIIRKVHTHTNYRLDVRSVISVAKRK